jgi:hypothetical protein
MSDLSVYTLLEVCRGEEGEMALGKHAACTQIAAGCGGVDYILHIVLEVITHILLVISRFFLFFLKNFACWIQFDAKRGKNI